MDHLQNLLVGSFHVHELVSGLYRLAHQGLIMGDILTPEQVHVVEVYARAHNLALYSRDAFVRRVFLPEVYHLGALCVGFNLPFDLSRLAVRAAPSRGKWEGGFTLYLTTSRTDPPIRVRALDSKRAFIGFASPWKPGRRESRGRTVFPGRFLDLRTLASALTGEGHSLESACKAFGVEHGKVPVARHGVVSEAYLDYNRRDIQATWELFMALCTEWHRHPFARVPTPLKAEQDPAAFLITRAYSPASLTKAYLRTMGIQPRLERQPEFSEEILGRCMAAYFGGRSECHIRREIVPATDSDVLSMYPSVCVLLGLFRFLVADRVVVEDATREARSLLARVTLENLARPDLWRRFAILAEVEPDGDILPVRAQYAEGGDYQIGLNVATAEPGRRLYYMLPDLVASKLLTGTVPRVRRAWRFRAEGLQPDLRRVKLMDEVDVDPRRDDFIRLLIERRHDIQRARDQASAAGDETRARYLDGLQHGLKTLANSVYGIMAEIAEKSTGAREAEVFGLHHFTTRITQEEHAGPYAFPPLAALITSAARLVLAMLEVELARRGATYAFCDTDSVAVVGSPKTVREVRAWLTSLNPYAFGGDLLKLEPVNDPHPGATKDPQLYCYAISAKRYVLFNVADDGSIIIRKASEHGLGHLLSPLPGGERGWIEEAWMAVLGWATTPSTSLGDGLRFADLPAVSRFPITKPSVLAPFAHLNTRVDAGTRKRVELPYTQQVKPFNFMLVAFPDTGDITAGGEAFWDEAEDLSGSLSSSTHQPIRPIAPYESDPRKWRRLKWVDLHTGKLVRLTWGREADGLRTSALRVQTYRDVLHRHVTHPEAKAAGPDGAPCGPATTGELSRLHVHVTWVRHIGKESHELEDVQAGLISAGTTYVHYVDEVAEWERDKQALKAVQRKLLARWSGLHLRSIKAILNTNRLPHRRNWRVLHEIAEKLRRRDSELLKHAPSLGFGGDSET